MKTTFKTLTLLLLIITTIMFIWILFSNVDFNAKYIFFLFFLFNLIGCLGTWCKE